jgi:hypothetical protein
VAPNTAAAGLQGCKANAAICRVTKQQQERCVKQRVAYAIGLGKLPRFLWTYRSSCLAGVCHVLARSDLEARQLQ